MERLKEAAGEACYWTITAIAEVTFWSITFALVGGVLCWLLGN